MGLVSLNRGNCRLFDDVGRWKWAVADFEFDDFAAFGLESLGGGENSERRFGLLRLRETTKGDSHGNPIIARRWLGRVVGSRIR